VIEHLPDMVFVKDAHALRFVRLNRRAEELLGYDRSELLGKSDYDFFPREQAEFFIRRDRDVLDGHGVVDIPAEPIDTRHGPRILHTKKIPIHDDLGRPQYLLGISEDITERHSAEQARAEERQARLARIEHVLGARAISMVFQPISDLATGDVVGAEALARFSATPVRPPDVWFAEAADVGLAVELELLAVKLALAQLHRLPPRAYLALNISPATLCTPAAAELFGRTASRRIVVELTEHSQVDDYDALHAALKPLRAAGIRVAVDDAGSGFASLRHILNIHPDIIKVDISITRHIDTDPARRALAAALVTFGHEIGATLIAEGVETCGELETLRALGVTSGQGYHLGQPAPLPIAGRDRDTIGVATQAR
jgi:PAS domain S-box-containing protein